MQGKTLVIKYGGRAMVNTQLMSAVAEDIVALHVAGVPVVLVHGGSTDIERLLSLSGIESVFVDGLRRTDERTMEIVQMVLCGKVNKDICALLQSKGASAVGLCGIDGGLLRAVRDTSRDLGLVGVIREVDMSLLRMIANAGMIPVVSPVALGMGIDEGRALNINADTAAAKLAVELDASEMALMTDTRGILRDVNDESSSIATMNARELAALAASGNIGTGMIPKIDGCLSAIASGVHQVRVIDGRVPHILQHIYLQGKTSGTLITSGEGLPPAH